MRTFHVFCMPKRNLLKSSKVEHLFLQRIRSFLLRDLVPSLIMLVLLSVCTLLVADKIYQAKVSRSHTITMIEEGGPHQKAPSLHGAPVRAN